MRVLITGCNGLLGQKLTNTLGSVRYDLFGIDLGDEGLLHDRLEQYHKLDIVKRRDTVSLIQNIHPDVIVHTAAMTGVDACEREKEKCWQINVVGTDNIVMGASRTGAKLVFISSDYVFDGKKGPYSEEDPPNPICYYGKSKLAAENLIRGSALHWTIIRTIVLFGLGINIRSCFVTWLLKMLRERQDVYIVSDQWGNVTLVDDLARAIERVILLERLGLFHVGGSEYLTRCELARQAAAIFELDANLIRPVLTEELHQPAPRPLKSGIDIEKAEKELYISFHNVGDSLRIYREQEQKLKTQPGVLSG